MRYDEKMEIVVKLTELNLHCIGRGVSRIFDRGGSNISWFPKKKVIRF